MELNEKTVKKKSGKRRPKDELRPEYDLSKLKGGVRGKYYCRPTAAVKIELIKKEPAGGVSGKALRKRPSQKP